MKIAKLTTTAGGVLLSVYYADLGAFVPYKTYTTPETLKKAAAYLVECGYKFISEEATA